MSESMPVHMNGFKDHPMYVDFVLSSWFFHPPPSIVPSRARVVQGRTRLMTTNLSSYVLERHLKREEVILPKREIGRFRGEPVYRRSNVVTTKTAENWMRIGRKVKERQEPLKWVKQRAVTLQKRRQHGEPILQGLYGENQTEVLIPPPIVDVSLFKSSQVGVGDVDEVCGD